MQELRPRQSVDHEIELMPGPKPLDQVPPRMTPSDLGFHPSIEGPLWHPRLILEEAEWEPKLGIQLHSS